MKSNYLNRITNILFQVRPRLARTHHVEYGNCFGAIAGYINSRIFISSGKFGIALKLPPKTITKLLRERGVKHLKYFPKGHIKKDYVIIPKRMVDEKVRLKKLVDKSIRFVLE